MADGPGGGTERERLLGLVAGYVLEHGIADLTLRKLGAAIGTNNRMLLYYFGTKERLISDALLAASHRFPRGSQRPRTTRSTGCSSRSTAWRCTSPDGSTGSSNASAGTGRTR